MARTLEAALARRDHGLRLDAVLTRTPPRDGPRCLPDVADLISARPSLVVECASHAAVREVVPELLAAGIDVIVVSIGAVADAALVARLDDAAAAGNARLAGLDAVVYEGRKPPLAWRGTPAEQVADLDTLATEAVLFEGTARDSAVLYPKNANVTAAVALAGVGFDRTQVRLIADPAASGNSHTLTASGAFGRFRIALENAPLPGNPKTSWLAALSVEQEVLAHFARLRF
jgi:aspartate dehydrogenase